METYFIQNILTGKKEINSKEERLPKASACDCHDSYHPNKTYRVCYKI